MRHPVAIAVAAGLLTAGVLSQPTSREQPPYRNPRLSTDERVRDLIARMTLEEKFWQLFMIPGDLDDPSHDYGNGVFGLQISTVNGQQSSGSA